MRGTVFATCLVAAAAAALPPVTAQQAFRAGVDLVHLPVVVTDRRGTVVRGLEPSDFEVLEDGKPQKIAFFAEGSTGEAVPLHLGLMLDRSDSMHADLRAAADAAIKFVNTLEEAADVTFVDFDTSINVGRFSPASYPRLFERIRDTKSGGNTSLYDAISRYVGSAADRDGQHVLLLYTDGGDSTSTTTYGKMQELLRLGNVLIYAVGYLENQLSSQRVPQQMRLGQIARETGGDAHFPSSAKEIDTVYEKILAELQSRYTIGYVSSNPPDVKGKFRKVEVRVTRADLKGSKVRTRTGYLPPAARNTAR